MEERAGRDRPPAATWFASELKPTRGAPEEPDVVDVLHHERPVGSGVVLRADLAGQAAPNVKRVPVEEGMSRPGMAVSVRRANVRPVQCMGMM